MNREVLDNTAAGPAVQRLIAQRYAVTQTLGQGAMGAVYETFDTLERKAVALKVMKPASGQADRSLLLFKQEYREAVSLRHPHLVEAYDFGVAEEGPFFTMELVEGEVLEAGKPYPYAQVCDWLVQLLLALDLIHSRGKLHRDVKPDNLRFTQSGELKVLDFGLLEPIGTHQPGHVTGTLTYMAPEVFSGKALSASADLYSVGVLAYELLTGKPPFTQTASSALIDAHLHQAPADLAVADLPPGLSALVMALLSKDPAYRPQYAGDVIRALRPWISSERADEGAHQAYTYLLPPGLVGRKDEMGTFLLAARQLQAGKGQGILIGADPGVGKSRLIDEFRVRCQLDEVPFILGRCTFEGGETYGAIRQVVRALAPLASQGLLSRHEPVLRFLAPDALPGGAADMTAFDTAILNDAVASFIAEVAAERSVVLCIDDLQWADALSLKVLLYCLDVHREAPVLWLGCYRLEEVGPQHAVHQAIEADLVVSLMLREFTQAECAELVAGMLGTRTLPDGMLDLLDRTAAGNGFFIVEMLRYLVDKAYLRYEEGAWRLELPPEHVGIPASIESLVVRRLEGLSADAQRLARLGAILAEDVEPHVIQALSELPEQRLLDAINELIEHQVWLKQETCFRFVHDRIREGVYQDLSPSERRDLHQEVALKLEAISARPATLAYHFVHGHDQKAGVRYLRKAGLEAERLGAIQEAFRHWMHASELLEGHPEWGLEALQLEVWLDIGMKCAFSVDSKAGEVALGKALARVETIGQPLVAARLMGGLIQAIKALPKSLSTPILARLSKPIPYRAPRGVWKRLPPNYMALVPLLIEANTWLAVCRNSNGHILESLEANAKAQALVPDRQSWAWGVVMTAYAYTRILEGKWDEGIRVARSSFELMKDEEHPNAINMSCGALVLANNQVFQGEPIDTSITEELRRRSAAHNLTEWQGMVQYALMTHYTQTGRAKEAQHSIDEATVYSKRCGQGTVLQYEIFLAQARTHCLLGEFDKALDVTAQGLRLNDVVDLPCFTSRFFEIRGRALLGQGQLDAAAREYREAIEREERIGIKFSIPECYLGLAEVSRRRGQLAEARAHIARAEAIIDDPEYRCEIKRIYLLRQQGRLAMSEGRLEEAHERLAGSLQLARQQDNPYQAALTLVDLGQLRRMEGDETEAIAHFNDAVRLYRSLDNAFGAEVVMGLLKKPEPAGPTLPVAPAQELQQLEILRRFSEQVARSRRVEEVFETLLVHAMEAVGGERGAILRVVPGGVEVVVSRQGNALSWGHGPSVSGSLVRRVLESGKPVLIADVLEDEHLSTMRSIMVQSLRTLLCLPLETEPEPLLLYADRENQLEGGFDDRHVRLLESLVQFGRIALENARLIEEAQARTERLSILNQVSLLVSSSLDIDRILESLLDQVLRLTRAEVAMVVATDLATPRILGSRDTTGEEVSYSRSVVEKVVSARSPLCILDTEASELVSSASIHSLKLKSIMCVPLEVQDTLLGVLYVSSKLSVRTFTDTDLDLLRAIGAHAALAIHNARQFQQIQDKKSMEAELAIAHTIQQGFFPEQMPEIAGLEIAGACQAAREVGGDFYDIIPLPDGRVALTVGDVSGKSVSAALYMAVVRTAVRIALGYGRSPQQCLVEVNSQIHGDIKDGSFITCFLGIYDPATGRFGYAAAGHNLGLLLTNDGIRPLSGRGVPLGMDPDVFSAVLESYEVPMAAGDRIVLYTDGVIEAMNASKQEFGEEALVETLAHARRASAEDTLRAVLKALQVHEAGAPAWDDTTLLIARVQG